LPRAPRIRASRPVARFATALGFAALALGFAAPAVAAEYYVKFLGRETRNSDEAESRRVTQQEGSRLSGAKHLQQQQRRSRQLDRTRIVVARRHCAGRAGARTEPDPDPDQQAATGHFQLRRQPEQRSTHQERPRHADPQRPVSNCNVGDRYRSVDLRQGRDGPVTRLEGRADHRVQRRNGLDQLHQRQVVRKVRPGASAYGWNGRERNSCPKRGRAPPAGGWEG
jgi:hypothetical protein